ncbi:MAG: DUF3638 domain-containing protein [Parachlamydiaceae bacterium]|nr:DUF3638 domain-containing protein [Parachlamydiaceae bacterium]
MVNFNQEGLNFSYQPLRQGKEERSRKSTQKATISYQILNSQGEVTESAHTKINELFTLVDKMLVSQEIGTDKTHNHDMVVQHLESDSFLIKIDNQTAFKVALSDKQRVEVSESRQVAQPFSKPLPLASNLLAGIDDKKLAFTQGDTFILRSGLEGGSTISNLQFLMPSIESDPYLKGNLDLAPLQECLLRELKERPTFDPKRNVHQIYYKEMKTYAKNLAQQVEELEVGKKLILSGGWASSGSGHAMIYLIEKTDNKTYAFTILNTGAGLEKYHSSQRVGYKRNYRPVLRLTGVDAQRLTKPEIFESLLELQISIQPGGYSWEHDSSDIYERIVPALQGRRDHAYENNSLLITAQRSGTCAWKVIMKLIQVLVKSDSKSTEPYKKFVFALRGDSLKAFYNRIVNRELEITDERLQLLKLSTENFARSASKQHREGLISQSELSGIKNFTNIILDDIHKFLVSPKAISPLNFKFNNFSAGLLAAEIFNEHTPTLRVIEEWSRAATVTQLPTYTTLPANPKELNELLQKVVVTCKELQNQQSARVSLDKVVELVKAIPLNALESEGYWDQFSAQATEEEIKNTIGLVDEISGLYFSGISLIPETERGTPDQYAVQMILLAATDKLVDALPGPFKNRTRLRHIEGLEIWNRNPFAIVNDGQLREILSLSRKFCVNKCDLFAFPTDLFSTEITLNFKNGKLLIPSYSLSLLELIYNQSDFKEKLLKIWPELEDASDFSLLEKAIKEFNDDLTRESPTTSDLFPGYIFAEMAQLLRLEYFSRNPHLQKMTQKEGKTVGKLNFKLIFLQDKIKLEGQLTGTFKLSSIERPAFDEDQILFKDRSAYTFESDKKNKFESGRNLAIKHPGLAKVFLPRRGNDFLSSRIWKTDSNDAVVKQSLAGLSRHETQQLAYYFSNDLIRIPGLIAYFKEQPTKFLDRDYQLFFYHGLFSGDLLESQIKSNPVATKLLVDFLEGQYILHKNMGNIQEELYFLWILNLLSNFSIPVPNHNTHSELQNLISEIKGVDIEAQRLKALAYALLIASQKQNVNLSDPECAELIQAYMFVRVMGYNHELSHPSIDSNMQDTMARVNMLVDKRDPSFYKPILQVISKECLNVTQNEWISNNGQYEDRKNGYRIDLKAFSIAHGSELIGGLPETITREPHFQMLFNTKTVIAKIPEPGIYTFTLPHGSDEGKTVDYQLFYSKEDSRLKIQKRLNGEWLTFLPSEQIKSVIPPKGLVENHFHWVAKSEEGLAHIYIEQQNNEQLVAVVNLHATDLNNPQSKYAIDTIQEINAIKESPKFLKDIYKVNAPLGQLFTFQPKELVQLWGDQHSSELEFPQLNIAFHYNNKGEAIYSFDPQYKMAVRQTPPAGLSEFSGFLKIEIKGKNTKIKYLIPKEPLSLTSALKGRLKTDKEIENPNAPNDISVDRKAKVGGLGRHIQIEHQETNTDFFEFQEVEGKLVGKTVEENLYLAYLHFAHKNAEVAFRLLSQTIAGKPLGYNESEDTIVKWFDKYIEAFDANTPQAKALQLKFLYLKVRNQAPFKDEKFTKTLSDTISQALISYYPLSHHTEIWTMTRAEELELLEFVAKNLGSLPEMLSIRKAQLEKAADQLTNQWLGDLEINAYNSKINIPTAIEFDEIDSLNLNKIILELQNAQKPNPVFYLDGEKWLADGYNQLLELACSDNEEERKSMLSTVSLLKISSKSKLYPLVKMLLLFAAHATSEMRIALKSEDFIKNTPEIEKLKAQCLQIEASKGVTIDEILTHEDINTPLEKLVSNGNLKFASLKPSSQPSQKFEPLANFKTVAPSVLGILEMGGIVIDRVGRNSSLKFPQMLAKSLNPPKGESTVVQKEFQRVQSSIINNFEEMKTTKTLNITPEIFLQLVKHPRIFDVEIKARKLQAEKQKEDILALANQLPIESTDSLIHALQLLGKKKREFSIDDLIILFLQKDGAALQQRNPALSVTGIQELSMLLTMYLLNTTEITHLEDLSQSIEVIEMLNEELKANALQELSMRILHERAYDPSQGNVMLVFEHYSGKRLRQKQVETIHQMTIGHPDEVQNLVTQLIMGSGKSKVILPLLAYLNSTGNNVPMMVVPGSLYETNLEDMRVLSGVLLNQEIETIQIAEGEPLSIKKLDEILRMMQRVKENKSYCLVKSSTIHHLHLYFKEAIIELPEDGKDSLEKFEKLKQLLNIFKNEVDCIVDEVDMVLDCTKEVNFSAGLRKNLSKISQNSLEAIFKGIFADPALNTFFRFEKESEVPFDEAKYKTYIKPLMAKMLLKMTDCDQLSQEEIERYLLADDSLELLPDFMQSTSAANKNLLALGKECLNTLLPLAMKKNSNEHYGLSKVARANKAIPYTRSNVPSEGSEFSSPYETAIYTMLYTLRKGVSKEQAQNLIKKYREDAINEHLQNGTALNQTAGYAKFAALSLAPDKDIFSVKEHELEDILDKFNSSMENKMKFARQFGWSEIEIFSERISSNSQHLVGLFHSLKGFTGTLWNQDTYHKDLQSAPDDQLDGKTLNILANNSSIRKDSKDIESLYKYLGDYHACIDSGAWFRGIDAIEVAKNMLSHLPDSIEGVVYFNDQDLPKGSKGQAVVLGREKNTLPSLLSVSKLNPKELFTYYNITVGADIAQHATAKALTTISKTMTLRDLLQAVWRMRGLDAGQRTDFAVPEGLIDIEEISPTAVFRLCTTNQAVRQRDDNLKSLKQQMGFIIDRCISNVFLSPKCTFQEAFDLITIVKKVLSQSTLEDPYILFGGLEKEEDIQSVVKSYVESILATFKDVYDSRPIFEQTYPWKSLEKEIWDLVNYDILPKREVVKNTANYGQEMQLRVAVQKEQKTLMNIKLELEVVTDTNNIERFGSYPNRLDFLTDDEFDTSRTSIFSNSGWERFKPLPLNTFFRQQFEHLNGINTKHKEFFSKHIAMTQNFMSIDNEPNKLIPFHTGHKPVTVCALVFDKKLDRQEELKLYFLHPDEVEFLTSGVDLDAQFDLKTVQDDYNKMLTAFAEIYFNEIEKERGKTIEQYFLDYAHLFKELKSPQTKQDILQKFLKIMADEGPSDRGIPNVLNELLVECKVIRSDQAKKFESLAVKEIREKNWPTVKETDNTTLPDFLWKNDYSYYDALQLFGKKDFNVVLIDPHTGPLNLGKYASEVEALQTTPAYIELMAQAKFYNGTLNNYTMAEQDYLKQWIAEKGVKEMLQLLLNNILRSRPADRELFKTSLMHKIFSSAQK